MGGMKTGGPLLFGDWGGNKKVHPKFEFGGVYAAF